MSFIGERTLVSRGAGQVVPIVLTDPTNRVPTAIAIETVARLPASAFAGSLGPTHNDRDSLII